MSVEQLAAESPFADKSAMHDSDEEKYFAMRPRTRVAIGLTYIAVAAALGWLMWYCHASAHTLVY